MIVILCFFGFISGMTTVVFGFGGGFITVPLLYSYLLLNTHNHADLSEHAMQIAVASSAFIMIISASLSTFTHHQKKNIVWSQIYPFLFTISIGAGLGALASTWANNQWIRWLFIAYLVIIILDCFVRPGFIQHNNATVTTNHHDTYLGMIIGIVAAFLGVGGSVMTVPLMRRRGVSMIQAAAMANPLTLPMALTSTITYALIAYYHHLDFGAGFVGFLYLKGALLLIIFSWLGIKTANVFMHKLPDTLHAKSYPILLSIVLLVMLFAPS